MNLRIFALSAVAAASLALSGCATSTLTSAMKNPSCVVKFSGEANFGSITPTGKVKVNGTCKPGTTTGPDAVKPADVANPPAPTG